MTESLSNFFTLLELDPNAPWDEMAYQRALRDAERRWTRQVSGPQSLPATATARRHLELIRSRTIQKVMEDDAAREAECKQAKDERTALLAARRKEFQDRLDLLVRRGHLLPQEVDSLRESFADVLADHPSLAKRLGKATVGSAGNGETAARLDSSITDQIRDQLRNAQALSLYDVLKTVDSRITPHSPRELLIEAADALYRREQSRKNKNDPAIKARKDLSGLAKRVFATDELRKRHDTSMRLAGLEELIAWLLEVLREAKAVSGGQVLAFLEKARTRGFDDVDLALRLLRENLGQRGWAIELPATEAEDRMRHLVQCPRCAQLNEPSSEICLMCAFDLREPCPACGAVKPCYGGCLCGFPIGQRDTVLDLIVQAMEALDSSRLPTAERLLEQAERIWRLPRGRDDQIAAKLRYIRARLVTTSQSIEQTQETIKVLMEAGKYVEVRDRLRVAPGGFPNRETHLQQAEARVKQARKLYEAALRPETPLERRVEFLHEALRRCEDFEAARTELTRIPLETPRAVRAEVLASTADVLVRWERSTEPDISYIVVRRTGLDAPESVEELPGQRPLCQVGGLSCRDRAIGEDAGLPLTYAVFAVRSGAYSAPGVAVPVVVTPDPKLRCQPGDGQVKLTWELPAHAEGVKISRRTMGASEAPVELATTGESFLIDPDVTNGVRYEYTARASYVIQELGTFWSEGGVEQAIPSKPLAPPGPLVLTSSPPQFKLAVHRVGIRFPEPERGEMRIFRQDGVGTSNEGDQGPEAILRPAGAELSGHPPLIDAYYDVASGFFSYVPVLQADGMRYVGKLRRYAIREEVSGLQGEFGGPVLQLGWIWPDAGERALVGHRTGGELIDATTADRPLSVTRVSGERVGGCLIPVGPGDTGMYVAVAVVVERDGVDFVTAGVRGHFVRPRVLVNYRVDGANGRRPTLALTATEPVGLPALELRGRPDRPPRTREDGTQIKAIDPLIVTGTSMVPLPKLVDRRLRYRLFTASPGEASTVELVPL
ncbi:hypothetical protein [Nonomuraea sp. NPDC048901]|uniref:hypothetical protein n=1 Tax=Nonomuraea sp. NPDC048901 TaxID=3155627 RepID=UPI0034093E1B